MLVIYRGCMNWLSNAPWTPRTVHLRSLSVADIVHTRAAATLGGQLDNNCKELLAWMLRGTEDCGIHALEETGRQNIRSKK